MGGSEMEMGLCISYPLRASQASQEKDHAPIGIDVRSPLR
jgi:hypothetical protein